MKFVEQTEWKWLPIRDLRPNPANSNKHSDEQIERLVKLIKYYGWRQPIIISNRSGLIAAGHARLLAAKAMGMSEVPVQYQNFEDDDEERGFLVSDNAIASWAELDLSLINTQLGDFDPGFDLDLLGIKDFTLDMSDKEFGSGEDEVPEAPPEPVVKRGELWILGEHRLLIDDCTSKENVERLMAGEKANMVFTDPPYGMDLDTDYTFAKNTYANVKSNGGNKYKPVIGDDRDFDPGTIFSIFEYCSEIFLWGADYYADKILKRNDGSWIVWDKRQNDSDDDEAAKSADKAFGSAFELCWSKTKHKRLFARIRSGIFGVNNEQGNSKRVHPTEKPVQLAQWFIERWSKDTNTLVDLFLGSGSTLIACEKTNRRCFGMEIDANYGQVIIERWQKFSGKKAVREDGVTFDSLKGGK